MDTPPRAIYTHVPFCRRRCGYCNFTVLAGRGDLHPAYLQALACEIDQLPTPLSVDTLYIGGGTPTELSVAELARLCELLHTAFPPHHGYEWSIEANPQGLDCAKLDVLRAAGVNRISLGVQSFQLGKLQLLERDHRPEDVAGIFPHIRARFPSISLDMICGVPGETLDTWRTDLQSALALAPDHLSIYCLTFEKGAAFWGRLMRGHLTQTDEETQRAMLETAWDQLTQQGWDHYEISNFARPGQRCRHNEVYWKGEPYFAIGPGAARYVDSRRETNHRSTTTYIRRVLSGQSPVADRDELEPADRAREMLVFRLRMIEGITRREFRQRTGFDLDQLAGKPLRKFARLGLVEDSADRIRLTREGLLVSDSLWPELL